MLKLFAVLINIPSCHTTIVITSLDTYVAANKQCIRLLQAHFPYFFRQANGRGCGWPEL